MVFVNKGSDFNLMKSLNKQGLVQRDVQVNSKHGSYVRKQWVSAGIPVFSKTPHSSSHDEKSSKKSKCLYFPKVDCGKPQIRAFSYSDIMLYYSKHKSEIKVPIHKFIQQNYVESDGHNQTSKIYQSFHHEGYTKDRQRLHQSIINSIVNSAGSPKPGEPPVAILMGGGTASGKGTIRSSVVLPKLQADGINVGISDCDDIKEQLPEYSYFKKQDINTAAARVHQESMDIAMEAFDALIDAHKNLLFDGTMKSVRKYTQMINQLHSAGYKIHIIGVDVPISTAKQRSQERAKATGRDVPDSIINMTHGGFASTFSELLPLVDSYVLYDNSGDNPEIIQDNSGVYKPDKLQEFQQKGQKYQDQKRIRNISKTYGVKEDEINDLYSSGATLDEIEEYYSLGLNA